MLDEYLKKTEPEYYPPVENLLDLIYEHYTENDPELSGGLPFLLLYYPVSKL